MAVFVPVDADRLAREHWRLALWLAHRHCASGADLDEIQGDALLGLARAIRRFDPERGLAFSTFAQPVIVGAILDGKRARDPLTRRQRRRARAEGTREWEQAPISLDQPTADAPDILVGETVPDPRHFLSGLLVADLYARLPDRERAILALSDAGYTQSEIGRLLGLSGPRVCQIRQAALHRLERFA